MSKSVSPTKFEILIVDDDKVISLLHKNHIRHFNSSCSPVACYDGKEALEYLSEKDKEGNCFLIFLDLNMPVINGWEFLKHIEKGDYLSKISVVVVTSSINSVDEKKALKYQSVISFCRKPLTEESIEQIVSLPEVQELLKISKLVTEKERTK